MAYPSLEQYNLAFQAHDKLLADPELKRGVVATTGMGTPQAISGGFALTYTISSGGKKYAVRCFHRASKELEKRYGAISRRIASLKSPYFLDFEFQPQGIKVNGGTFPVVKMAWAKGETLGEFLESNRGKPQALASLSTALEGLAAFLEKEQIAHGDLQTGNLMVSGQGAAIQLIDYDGMYVDEIKALGSTELGHINFQHPDRKGCNPFGPRTDRFSLIVLWIALKALQESAALWDKTNSELDAVIFRANDFLDPGSSPAFALLSANKSLAAEAKKFAAICKAPLEKIPSLADFLAGRNIPASDIQLTGIAIPGRTKPGYLGVYDVLSASDYEVCLRKVGDKVEAIGCIVSIKEGLAVNCKPYLFINFGNWRGKIFKIAIWSDGLDALSKAPDSSWVGKWISVVGLMEPPFSNAKLKYTHLSINVTTNGQITVISEQEAKWRLAGPTPAAIAPTASNREALDRIRDSSGFCRPTTGAAVPPVSPKPQAATANQAILNKIRAAQQLAPAPQRTAQPQPRSLPQRTAPPIVHTRTPPAPVPPRASQTPAASSPHSRSSYQNNRQQQDGWLKRLVRWVFG